MFLQKAGCINQIAAHNLGADLMNTVNTNLLFPELVFNFTPVSNISAVSSAQNGVMAPQDAAPSTNSTSSGLPLSSGSDPQLATSSSGVVGTRSGH